MVAHKEALPEDTIKTERKRNADNFLKMPGLERPGNKHAFCLEDSPKEKQEIKQKKKEMEVAGELT